MNPLIRAIPAPLVRFFARPYVAGDSLEGALDVAKANLDNAGVLTSLDLLAEGIDTEDIVRQNLNTYLEMVDRTAARFPDPTHRPTLSLKQSSYTTSPLESGGDGSGAREAVQAIAERARSKGVQLTVDMEGSDWTDFTLETLNVLQRDGHDHVGAVIQTRLHRSPDDLDRLPPGCRVRLVIGIYQEPAERAVTDKREMKERLLTFGRILLERGHYVELGTHDESYVKRFVEDVAPSVGASTEQFEVQLLYGVPRDSLVAWLQARNVRVRLYVPFAIGWKMAIAYLRRRLDEYPAMMFMVARNMLGIG